MKFMKTQEEKSVEFAVNSELCRKLLIDVFVVRTIRNTDDPCVVVRRKGLELSSCVSLTAPQYIRDFKYHMIDLSKSEISQLILVFNSIDPTAYRTFPDCTVRKSTG